MGVAGKTTKLQKVAVVVVVCVLIVASALAGRALLKQMDSAIEQNGKTNMQAVVEQVQQAYELQVENYYSRLRVVGRYVSKDASRKGSELKFLVTQLQEETGSQVFFIKDNGTAKTIDKEERRLDISTTLLMSLRENQSIAKLVSYTSDGKSQSGFLLAIPCDEYSFDGQAYTSVGVLVDRSQMDSALKLYAYGGEAYIFVIDADGDVTYSNQEDEKLFQNYMLLKHLQKDDALTQEQMDALQASFANQETAVELLGGSRAYYLGYIPVQNSSSTLVCIAAKGVIESSLISYQKMVFYSVLAVALVMLVLLGAVFFSLSRLSVASQRARFDRESLQQQREHARNLEALNAELKEAQDATVQALQSAQSANKAKTAFLSNMSHDIRTPMNAIIGITSLIEHDAGDEAKVREYVRRVEASSHNLLSLINEVLDMNKIEAGKTTLSYIDFSMTELVRDIEGMFRPQAEAKHQELEVEAAGIQHDWLSGDAVRLMQVTSNLLSNAVKYTPKGGEVRLLVEELASASASYAKFRIVVSDNGMGMEPEFQEKIFDAFTREESSLTNKIQGTGLGMAITKSLVDLMGGTIAVSSTKGEGSSFEVIIDLKVASQAETPLASGHHDGPQEEVSLEGMRFLAAEDNSLNAEILVELLKLEGAQCTVCDNGAQLVETFESSKPGDWDMILLDVQMPVMNGYQAASAIRASSHALAASIPIIAMTANAFSEDIQASLAAGMNAHVSKPVDMGVLKKTIGDIQAECGA